MPCLGLLCVGGGVGGFCAGVLTTHACAWHCRANPCLPKRPQQDRASNTEPIAAAAAHMLTCCPHCSLWAALWTKPALWASLPAFLACAQVHALAWHAIVTHSVLRRPQQGQTRCTNVIAEAEASSNMRLPALTSGKPWNRKR